jgi:hypothetical protein
MNKINNPVMPLLIIFLTLLTFDFVYKNQVKNTASFRNEGSTIEERVEPEQNNGKENTVGNPFTLPESPSEKEFQLFEIIEKEGINTKFYTGIIL